MVDSYTFSNTIRSIVYLITIPIEPYGMFTGACLLPLEKNLILVHIPGFQLNLAQ